MKRTLFILSFILCSSLIVLAQAPKEDDPNAPQIKFEKLIHDYGMIAKGSDGKSTFKFTNTGKEPLILSKPRSSCGCTVPTWPKEPILPGKSENIDVTYNTNIKGAFMKTVAIMSNAKTPIVVLRIKGEVVDKETNGTPKKKSGLVPTNK